MQTPEDKINRVIKLSDDSQLSVEEVPTVQLFPDNPQFAATSDVGMAPLTGVILCERFVVQRLVGRGGSSLVYRALDLRENQLVAVKLLRTEQRTDPRARARLEREFRQMQRLSHPDVARVFDLYCDGESCLFSMELIAGRTVQAWMQTGGTDADTRRIIVGCAAALEYAHFLGIVHGDLKPTNVMVTNDGSVKLIDFGSVTAYGRGGHEGLNPTATATPLFASPQILAGKSAEPRDDVFSLACLSYCILSGGRHPFGGRPSLEDGRAKSAPNHVRTIPAALFEVIERGLSAERERRQASAREYLREFTAADLFRRAEAASGSDVCVIEPAPPKRAAMNRRFDGARSRYRRVQPWMRPVASAVAIVGVAMLFQLGPRRDAIRTAELPPAAAPIVPSAPSSASARPEVVALPESSANSLGVISFEAATLHASAAQSLVAIAVKRRHPINRRAAFTYRVEKGTARPGVDYERVPPQVVRFVEGQAARTLFIPLINARDPGIAGAPRTFTVALEQVAGGPPLGRFAKITVEIDPRAGPPRFSARTARAN